MRAAEKLDFEEQNRFIFATGHHATSIAAQKHTRASATTKRRVRVRVRGW
jgi:hypothetical protein